jgi:hypothetical protein
MPERIGLIGGLFYGLNFGLAGIAAAVLGGLADSIGIENVYHLCAFLPLAGLLTWFLPRIDDKTARDRQWTASSVRRRPDIGGSPGCSAPRTPIELHETRNSSAAFTTDEAGG